MSVERLGRLVLAGWLTLLGSLASAQEEVPEPGRRLYQEHCAPCHGESGRGDGPRSEKLGVAPRDFTLGAFKCRSTPTGEPPTAADLARVIREGLPGTPMTGFGRKLQAGEVQAIVDYLPTLAPVLDERSPPPALEVPKPPAATQEMVLEGRAVYGLLKCWRCHGVHGRGDGPAVESLEAGWGETVQVRDFTRARRFKCGSDAVDLYRTLHTGMTGSPMPSFTEAFAFASNRVGEPQALTDALGSETVTAMMQWLDTQPTASELDGLDASARRRLVERRTWALVAFLRSLSGG